MNYMFYEQNNGKQKNYEDARKDLFQALDSFSKLDDNQKRQLIYEFANCGAAMNVIAMLQQRFR